MATLSTPVDGESGPDWVWPYLLYLGMRTSRAPPGSYKRSTQGWLSAATLSIWGSAGTGFFQSRSLPLSQASGTRCGGLVIHVSEFRAATTPQGISRVRRPFVLMFMNCRIYDGM